MDKKEGETPLCALENFRKNNPEYLNVQMTYAGRLDPMASGVLVALAGAGIKDKAKYLALDKEYDFSVLFGFATDTYDILGKVSNASFDVLERNPSEKDFIELIKHNLAYFQGKLRQEYPMYSSKTVYGKPLFSYARSGEEVEIPTREIFIKKISLKKVTKISSRKLLSSIEKRIKKVEGDFRQEEILNIWQKNLSGKHGEQIFYVGDFKVVCSSGTYVRGIANFLGEKINIPALALSIKRTKIGKFV